MQATAVAQSPVKMISQPCKDPESNISNQRKFGIQTPVSTQKPPLPPRRLPKLKIDGTETESVKASNLCSGTSSFTNYNSGLSEIMESKPQVYSVRLVEEKLKSGENGYKALKDQIKLQGICGGEDMTLNTNDNSVLLKPFEKLAKNNSDSKVVCGSLKGTKTSESDPESKDSHESEPNRISEPCLLPGILLDCGADVAKLVECQNLNDCTLVSIDSKPVSEKDGIHDGTTLMELGKMEEHHLEDVHSAEDVFAVGQKSEQEVLSENDASTEQADHTNNEDKDHLEDVHSAEDVTAVSQKSELEVLFENDCSTEHANHANYEDKELDPYCEVPSCNYDSQPQDKSCPEHENSSIKQTCVLRDEENAVKNQEDQDQQMKNSSCESERIACDKNECPEIDRLMFEEDTFFLEESQKFENGNTADVYPEVSSHGSGFENPGSLLREKMDCVVRGLEESNCVIKKQEESCEFQHSGNKAEEDLTVSVLGAGVGLISQGNEENNASEVNDFESLLDQGDHNEIELKISSPPTFHYDDAGQNKEAEISKAEDSPTPEIQQSVKNLQFSLKQDRGSNVTKADSFESTLDTEDEHPKGEQCVYLFASCVTIK